MGIEDCLHIEFEYSQSKFNLKDVVVGKVYFLLVRLKIKVSSFSVGVGITLIFLQHMELDIIRREVTGAGAGSNQLGGTTDNETVTKFEIMDGSPVRGNEGIRCSHENSDEILGNSCWFLNTSS